VPLAYVSRRIMARSDCLVITMRGDRQQIYRARQPRRQYAGQDTDPLRSSGKSTATPTSSIANMHNEISFPPSTQTQGPDNSKLSSAINRKMDIALLPFLSMLYLMNGLDRSNIGNAETQGTPSVFSRRLRALPNICHQASVEILELLLTI
jgi:hypothetical protein